MSHTEFFTAFKTRFEGRTDVYALARPHRNPQKAAIGKLEYFPVWEPLTDDVLYAHLKGEQLVGVYPLVEGNVKWFAIDFDGGKDPETGARIEGSFEASFDAAEAQAEKLEEVGLQVYLERSRSGKGVHLWGFLSDWVSGATVRAAIAPHLLDAETLDRMYPVQPDALTGQKLGNLIALPFYGKAVKENNSIFVHRGVPGPIPPREFMASLYLNEPDAIERIAASAPKSRSKSEARRGETDSEYFSDFEGRPERPMRGWLKAQSQYGCKFLHEAFKQRQTLTEPAWYAAIQQTTCFENGRAIAHAISRDYPGYNPSEVDAKYDHACKSPPVGCAYIHEHFPSMACSGCPLKAPYHVASQSILELVQESDTGMEKGGYDEFYDKVLAFDEGEQNGIKMGYKNLDDIVTLRRAEFTIIAARPSMGKTAFMVDASNKLADQGVHVFRFSAETGETGLKARDLGREAEINTAALRGDRRVNGKRVKLTEIEKKSLREAKDILNQKPMYTNYTALDPDRIIEIIEAEILRRGIPLDEHFVVFFDYVQFGIKKPDESGYERVSRLSTQFKYIAKILNCSVVAFAQLNRGAEEEEPSLSSLKESGQLEQDGDLIIFVHGERESSDSSVRVLIVAKQREGPTGSVNTLFKKDVCRFEPLYEARPQERPDILSLVSEDADDA